MQVVALLKRRPFEGDECRKRAGVVKLLGGEAALPVSTETLLTTPSMMYYQDKDPEAIN
ncbi:hypothetical protein [Ovoidimarina sediminis]|uniref:hypothetical protein n=1 Tax=Ovoidimarina sediminis TaxID=3079856 RepID=UPI00290EBFA3|nr:hypothetical protein [Rhodophyticola sp. MJ-SS7]MDU8944295.1 hypothetical protein [Rhodophyticola sp. MJ-SS7]